MTERFTTLPEAHKSSGKKALSAKQLEYFKKRLLKWQAEILAEIQEARGRLAQDPHGEHDEADRAESETINEIEIRTMERERKLLVKIEEALARIKDGSYGYCRLSGKPIELERLKARPIATLCLEEQKKHERTEQRHRLNGE